MYKKYIVRLTAEEREICHETIHRGGSERVRRARILLKADADGRIDGGVFVSDEDSRERSPELGRRRSGSGTEADAAGAEDSRQRGGSQGHRPVRGATRVRQLVVAVAGRESCGVRGLHKPRNGEADAKKRLFLQKESPVLGTRKRSSWRNKCLKSNLTTRSVPLVCMDEQPLQLVDARAGYRGPSATRRLRVRAGGHRLHVLRGPVLLAPGDGGLGRRGRQPAGGPLRELRAPSCATTSTPARRERSAKRPARARELVKRSATRRSTGAG